MKERGFSLSEILVSLLLITSISLALLKQQWQVHRLQIRITQQEVDWLHQMNERERGSTVLEYMLGLTLALAIMSVLIQQYLQIKHQCYATEQAIAQTARLQVVFDLLRRKGHQAGFTPCLPIKHLMTFDQRNQHNLSTLLLEKAPVLTLSFYRMSSFFGQLQPISESGQFELIGNVIPNSNHPVIIADCQHAEVHGTYQISGRRIQFSHALRFTYQPPIYWGEWLEERFWVKPNAQGQSALWYQYHQHTDELLPGVQALQGQLISRHGQQVLELKLDLGSNKLMPLVIRITHS